MQFRRLCVSGESPLADLATAPSLFGLPTVASSLFLEISVCVASRKQKKGCQGARSF